MSEAKRVTGFFSRNSSLLVGLFDFFERLTVSGAVSVAGGLAAIYREHFFSTLYLQFLVSIFGWALVLVGAASSGVVTLLYWHQLNEEAIRNPLVDKRLFQILSGFIGWPFFVLALLIAVLRIGQ